MAARKLVMAFCAITGVDVFAGFGTSFLLASAWVTFFIRSSGTGAGPELAHVRPRRPVLARMWHDRPGFAGCFDGLLQPVSNCHVQPTRPADIIFADPRTFSRRVAWPMTVVLVATALIAAILVAVHYRGEAASVRRQLHSNGTPVPVSTGSLALSSTTVALPAPGPLAGQVTVFAVRSSARQAQIIVTARITGGRPHSRYELFGAGCAGNAAVRTWAAGIADARGSADLTGQAWTVSVSTEYYIVLGAPGMYQDHPGPAVHGYLGIARGLSAVRGGIAPCAP
jgi:hypothetical protein